MRKVILWMSMSLDGFFEGPDHDISWHRMDDELHTHINDELAGMGAFLDGRVTFELMADYWPTADADPESPAPVARFAGIWRDMPKVVYSRTLQAAGWGATVVREVVAEDVQALKSQPGGDLVLGGANLAATFFELDLVDELRIYVHPVVVGAGRRPLPASERHLPLRLAESRTFGNGVVLLRYDVLDGSTDE
jgi:dihydrofolate reductase